MKSTELGIIGEKIARNYLISKGYIILINNFKTKFGEIDIICKQNNILVFIEVKARKNSIYGYASEFVDYRKQEKIIKTAQCYIKLHRLDGLDIRFDVIEVYFKQKKINHLVNAF